MKIAIITPTFYKIDGSTKTHLIQTLNSVKNQTHKDYKLYLIGDDYEDIYEFEQYREYLPKDKIHLENLPEALERNEYSGRLLWMCGGTNATNVGIKRALDEGFDYICLLDHDDIFEPNHLEEISKCIESTHTNFVAVRCGTLPPDESTDYYTNYRPKGEKIYKVSACINLKYFNILMNNLAENNIPSDSDFFNRIHQLLKDKDEWGILINIKSCKHPSEGVCLHNPDIVKKNSTSKINNDSILKNKSEKKSYTFTEDWFKYNDIIKFLKFDSNKELHFLEVGSYEGKSTIWFIENFMNHLNSTVTCIDPWENYSQNEDSYESYSSINALHNLSEIQKRFNNNIELSGRKNKVIVKQGYSYNILPQLIANKEKYDFIFIDGNHTAPFVLTDAVMSWYLLKKDGMLVFDDYLWKNPFVKSEDPLLSPKIAIDTFLDIFKNNLTIIWRDYRLALIKNN